MTSTSTTIRVSVSQREHLRTLAERRGATLTDTLDAALESLRRDDFYRSMAAAEAELRADPPAWSRFVVERDTWLDAELS